MTVTAEPKPRAIFGQITLDDMRGNELLTKTVMPLVAQVCAFSNGRFNVRDVARGIAAGDYRVWGVMRPPAKLDAVSVTTVRGPVFEILMLGPDPADMTPFLPMFMGEAREQRCQRLQVFGSPRWRKHFDDGWRKLTVYEKDL